MTDTLFENIPGISLNIRPMPIEYAMVDYHAESAAVVLKGFLDALYRGDFIYVTRLHFHCEPQGALSIESLAFYLPPFEVVRHVFSAKRPGNFDTLMKGSDSWARADVGNGYIAFEFGTQTIEEGQAMAARFRGGLETRHVPKIVTNFIAHSDDNSSNHSFGDVDWATIESNYSTGRLAVQELIGLECESYRLKSRERTTTPAKRR